MKRILALVAIVFAFGACKKDTHVPVQEGYVVTPHTISTASVYSGAFIAGNYTVVSSSGTTTSSDAMASFYSPPKANKMISAGIEVPSLKLNGENVMYDQNKKYYIRHDWNIESGQLWMVNGNSSINSFVFETNAPTPSCATFDVIPDSVSLSEGFTLHIPGVTNATPGARIIIYDGSYNEVTSKPVTNGDNIVSFSSSDFTYFGEQGFVLIQLENNHAYNFNGQDFIFVKAKGFMKQVKFKP